MICAVNQMSRVYIIPQTHELPPRMESTPELIQKATDSQQHVLDTLIEHKAKHVFPESYAVIDSEAKIKNIRDFVQEDLSDYSPRQKLNFFQSVVLLKAGAHRIFPHLHEGVTLHQSVDRDIQIRAEKTATEIHDRLSDLEVAQQKLNLSSGSLDELSRYYSKKADLEELKPQLKKNVISARDESCAKFVGAFLDKHPNEAAYVIMGRAHTTLKHTIEKACPGTEVTVLDGVVA